jgi:hypothetical protein
MFGIFLLPKCSPTKMRRCDVEQNPLGVRYHWTIGEETSANGLKDEREK